MTEGLDFERPGPRKSCSRVHAVHILQNRPIPNKIAIWTQHGIQKETKEDQKVSPIKDFYELGGLWGGVIFMYASRAPHERPKSAPRAPRKRHGTPRVSGLHPGTTRDAYRGGLERKGYTPVQRGTLTRAGRNGRATPRYARAGLPLRAGTERALGPNI